jgi:hypothetical protein
VAEWIETQTPPKEREMEHWTTNFDGSFQLQGEGVGILVTSPKGEIFKYVLQLHFLASNSAAEYEALHHDLRIATALGICDSKFSGIHCSLSTGATKSSQIWMTK